MATAVEMPKPGNTVEECLLTAWRKHPGDRVTAGEVIADIETDKAVFELTSPADGVLLRTFFDDGAIVPVFTTVCEVGAEGEAGGSVPVPRGPVEPVDAVTPPVVAPPAVAPPSAVHATRADAAAPAPAPALSPRARRFAREHDVDTAGVAGTGPRGRVLEEDLVARVQERMRTSAADVAMPASAPVAAVPPPVEPVAPPVQPAAPVTGSEPPAVPLSWVRRTIARRLREGMAATVQYTVHGSADAGRLLALRRELKRSPDTAGVTVGDLVAFCTVRALVAAPELNAELVDGSLRVHREVHLAFACDTPRGLVVPVVRDCARLPLVDLSRRMARLAAQAVDGDIAVDDINGGSFTISNLGAMGVEWFTPVLNPPQVAILGVDAIAPRAARKADGNIEFVDAIGLSLTVDHQVVDGAAAARFLALVRTNVEQVDVLCAT